MTLTPWHPTDVPPGYPRRYERRIRLADGRHVFTRPIVPADAPALEAAFRSADPDTLRRRFLGTPPPVTPALLRRLTTLDYVHRFALGAGDAATGGGIAIARYEPLAPGVAEIAIVVDPRWRRVGVATALTVMLADAAVDRGITSFHAVYYADNRAVSALLGLAGPVGKRLISHGIAEYVAELDRGRITVAMDGVDQRPDRRPATR